MRRKCRLYDTVWCENGKSRCVRKIIRIGGGEKLRGDVDNGGVSPHGFERFVEAKLWAENLDI